MAAPTGIEELLNLFRDRGFNTVIVPVLHEGSVLFRTSSGGHIKMKRRCPARDVLKTLRDFPFSVWLSMDILTAGTGGTGQLGSLARDHGEWLMKNYRGGHEIPPGGRIPGLFCWTALNYRRFVGNMLVEIVEGYPVDGFLFDVRNLPQTRAEDPETWTHLGYSCLRRIQEELGVDLEDFLTQPTKKLFQAVMDWRMAEFAHFIEVIKARAQKSRELPVCLLASLGDPEDPFVPWRESFAKGIIDEVVLRMEAADAPAQVAALDEAMSDPRPFLIAARDEKHLEDVQEAARITPATGFVVVRPDSESKTPLPPVPYTWETPGALESHPITAALSLIEQLVSKLDPADPATFFFRSLEDYLSQGGESLRFAEVLKVREDVNLVRRKVEEGEEMMVDREDTLRQLDRVSRLLLLAAAPPIEA